MRRLLPILATAALLAVAGGALAQEALRIDDVDLSDHPTVRLVVTAPSSLVGIDASGGFLVEENGRLRPTDAEALAGEPLEVMLVVDTSGSMQGVPLASAIEAAQQFVDRMPPTTQVGVIGFGSEVGEVFGFTDDREAVSGALDTLTAFGDTALYDALLAASAEFDRGHTARRFVVLLSDGADTVSAAGIEDVATALDETAITLYAVRLNTTESDPGALSELTDRVVPADDAEALAGAYGEIADELISQYVVVYESDSFGPTDLLVTVTHEGVTATATLTVEMPAPPATTEATVTTVAATVAPSTIPEPDTEAVASELTPFIGRGPGAFGTTRAVVIGFVAVFLALVALLTPAMATDGGGKRLLGTTRATRVSGSAMGGAVSAVSNRVETIATRFLRRRGRETALNHALDAAGLALRPGEFIVMVASGALVCFAVGAILGGWILGLVLAAAGLGIAVGLLRLRTDRRRLAFGDQLEGTLQLVAGSLRAGYGLMQAVNTVASEAAAPTSEEFERVVMETRLGRDLIDSLEALSGRVANEDFGWIVQAIRIQREVGGDLSELLDTITSTIRDRHQVHRQVRALSAEGRLSALVLILLPLGLAGIIMITSPGYLTVLVETSVGKILIAAGVVLMAIGAVWIRRIIRLTF